MPALRIQRKERFARLLAAGKSASEAYELAGYKRDASGANSCHLAKSDEVTNRVQELTREAFERERAVAAAAVQRTAITRQSLVEKLEEEAGQYGAAVAASKEISVLLGIRIERSERGGPGEFDWVDRLNLEELRALAKGELDVDAYRKDPRAVN